MKDKPSFLSSRKIRFINRLHFLNIWAFFIYRGKSFSKSTTIFFIQEWSWYRNIKNRKIQNILMPDFAKRNNQELAILKDLL